MEHQPSPAGCPTRTTRAVTRRHTHTQRKRERNTGRVPVPIGKYGLFPLSWLNNPTHTAHFHPKHSQSVAISRNGVSGMFWPLCGVFPTFPAVCWCPLYTPPRQISHPESCVHFSAFLFFFSGYFFGCSFSLYLGGCRKTNVGALSRFC